MNEQINAFQDNKKAEVKSKNIKGKKSKIVSSVIISLFMLAVIGFTLINYMIHVNDYENMFESEPDSGILISMVKPLIIENTIIIDNESLNKLIAYEVQTNIESYIKQNGINIDGVSVSFTGENEIMLYLKVTDRSTKVISSHMNISFDTEKQELIADIKDVKIGRLSIPEFIWKMLLNDIVSGERLRINGDRISMPLSLSDGENPKYIPKIIDFYIKDDKITIKTDNVFGKQFDVLYNILGDKAKTVINTVIDTVISSDNSQKPYRLLYKCVRELSEKFGD